MFEISPGLLNYVTAWRHKEPCCSHTHISDF